jgi:hypothetical protein
MKVKGSYSPQPFEMEVVRGKAVLRFHENVAEVMEEGETPVMGFEFDRYTIYRPYDSGLRGRVESDIAAWLSLAKREEYDSFAAEVRAERNRRLTDSDMTQLPDAPVDVELKNAWRAYRQALRDIPDQEGFPYSVTFPEKPTAQRGGVLI